MQVHNFSHDKSFSHLKSVECCVEYEIKSNFWHICDVRSQYPVHTTHTHMRVLVIKREHIKL